MSQLSSAFRMLTFLSKYSNPHFFVLYLQNLLSVPPLDTWCFYMIRKFLYAVSDN